MVREVQMTKYHQQAQATNNKRKIWRAELKQDDKGMFTLTPSETEKKTSAKKSKS